MDDDNSGTYDTQETPHLPVEVESLLEQLGGENSTGRRKERKGGSGIGKKGVGEGRRDREEGSGRGGERGGGEREWEEGRGGKVRRGWEGG